MASETIKKWTANSEWNKLSRILTHEQPKVIMVTIEKKTPA